jgi:hypothetical protein
MANTDHIAWGVFQEVRGAWEQIPGAMRNALHPSMRSALALRILSVRRAEGGEAGNKITAAEVRRRCNDTIALAASSLGALNLEHSEENGGTCVAPAYLFWHAKVLQHSAPVYKDKQKSCILTQKFRRRVSST